MIQADFLLRGCGEIVTPTGGDQAQRGAALSQVRRVENGAIAARAGRIVAVGPEADVLLQLERLPGCVEIDAAQRSVIPGFVDPHTHAVYGRTRTEDYAARIAGSTYVEIAAAGGGIHSSVRDLAARSEAELFDLSLERLQSILAHGTTTIEIKTGYGLDLEQELKTLRVIRQLGESLPLGIVPTFLGAHEIPLGYRSRRSAYVDLLVHTMLPAVAPLAAFNDVFCEPSVFGLAEAERILRAGIDLGLPAKVHADELEAFGATELACGLGATSADHLVRVTPSGIAALANSPTVAVLLPATSLGLASTHFAPARRLIEAGATVALATDFNPGSSQCPSMQAVWSLACSMLRMTPAEALVACTQNAAVAVGRAASVGSLEPGKRCDLVVTKGKDYREVPFQLGVNHVDTVVCGGRVAWRQP